MAFLLLSIFMRGVWGSGWGTALGGEGMCYTWSSVTVLQCCSVTPGVGRVITLSIQGAARKGGQLYTPAA